MGNFSVPVGGVMPWPDRGDIPEGWQIADGDNGTLDLCEVPVVSNPGNPAAVIVPGVWIQKVAIFRRLLYEEAKEEAA